jgi:hypothetical protein
MIFKNKFIIYIFFVFSIFLGFFFQENASGGAKIDYEFWTPFINAFSNDFSSGLNLFTNNPGSFLHTPFYYIIIGFLLKVLNSFYLVNLLYILICCSIPYIFYLVIKNKFEGDKNYFFYFSLIIFLSPYFRSSAIWLLGDNLSILFFLLSILFYIKTDNNKNIKVNYYLCLIFLILCCYIRYYYFIFVFYFLINFYNKLELKDFIKIIILGFIFSIPQLIYINYIIQNYDFINFISNKVNINYFNNTIIILSILLFYLSPLIINHLDKIYKFYETKKKNFIYFMFFILIFFIVDQYFFTQLIELNLKLGGGVFQKLFKLVGLQNELFYLPVLLLSIVIIDFIFRGNRINNYFVLLLLILSLPLPTIYQKYLDPLIFIIIFGLIDSHDIKKMLLNKSIKLTSLYVYFSTFLLFSITYYY